MTGFTEIQDRHFKYGKFYFFFVSGYTYGMYDMSTNVQNDLGFTNDVMTTIFLFVVIVPLLYLGYVYWTKKNMDNAYSKNND